MRSASSDCNRRAENMMSLATLGPTTSTNCFSPSSPYAAPHRRRDAELRVRRGKAQIGVQRHAEPAPEAIAVDHRDQRLFQIEQLLPQFGTRLARQPHGFGVGARLLEAFDISA